MAVPDRRGVVAQDGLHLVALLRFREDLRETRSVEGARREGTRRGYLLLRAQLLQHAARLPLLRQDVQEAVAGDEDDHARRHDVREVQQDLAELCDLSSFIHSHQHDSVSEERAGAEAEGRTRESSPRCWNLNVSSPPLGPFFRTSVWRFDAGMMCPHENVARRSGGRLEKSWFTTSDICVQVPCVS